MILEEQCWGFRRTLFPDLEDESVSPSQSVVEDAHRDMKLMLGKLEGMRIENNANLYHTIEEINRAHQHVGSRRFNAPKDEARRILLLIDQRQELDNKVLDIDRLTRVAQNTIGIITTLLSVRGSSSSSSSSNTSSSSEHNAGGGSVDLEKPPELHDHHMGSGGFSGDPDRGAEDP